MPSAILSMKKVGIIHPINFFVKDSKSYARLTNFHKHHVTKTATENTSWERSCMNLDLILGIKSVDYCFD